VGQKLKLRVVLQRAAGQRREGIGPKGEGGDPGGRQATPEQFAAGNGHNWLLKENKRRNNTAYPPFPRAGLFDPVARCARSDSASASVSERQKPRAERFWSSPFHAAAFSPTLTLA